MSSKLRVISPYNRAWAITEDRLVQLCEGYDRHQAGERLDFEGLRAAVEKRTPQQTGGQGYQVQDGVAIIDIDGVLGKGMNLFMWLCGGRSTEMLQNDLAAAADDDGVHSIVLSVDSPGGTVDGTELAANAVSAAAQKKPVVSVINGCGCSAAYWIAAMADKVYISDRTTEVGSIGVLVTHTDRSKSDEQRGIKRTHITSGKYKRIAADNAPLSTDGANYLQDSTDYLYSVFMPTMAAARGMDPDAMHETAADGRVLIGQQAVDAGLVDGIKTLDQVVSELNSDYQTKLKNPGARASAYRSTGDKTMDPKYTEEQLTAARAEEFEKGKQAGLEEGRKAGAAAETERVKGVLSAGLPGHGELIKSLAFDGKTSVAEASLKVVAAEREKLAKAGKDLENDSPAPAPGVVVDPSQPNEPKPVEKGANGGDANTSAIDPNDLAKKATAYVTSEAGQGRKVSFAEAVEHVSEAAK